MKIISAILLLISLSGCFSNSLKDNSTLYLTYYSRPSGASLYDGNNYLGRTPLTLNYTITEQNKRSSSMSLKGIKAVWVSGATQAISSLKPNWDYGTRQNYTFVRPSGVAGLDKDTSYELQIERNQILKNQAAQEKESYDVLGNLVNTLIENQNKKKRYYAPPPVKQAVPHYNYPTAGPSILNDSLNSSFDKQQFIKDITR